MTNNEAIHTIDAIRIITVKDCTWLQKEIDKINEACDMAINALTAQPETHEERTETHACDCISKTAAIDIVEFECGEWRGLAKTIAEEIEQLPPAQPERTCVNCGRTANNGGWYADGGTRCPIEEHYALPKDGFCHLWGKRNITDDDYPERRTDE